MRKKISKFLNYAIVANLLMIAGLVDMQGSNDAVHLLTKSGKYEAISSDNKYRELTTLLDESKNEIRGRIRAVVFTNYRSSLGQPKDETQVIRTAP